MGRRDVNGKGFSTRCVHAGRTDEQPINPHIVPIYQTVNFEYDDFDHKVRVSEEEEPGYLYTRYGNPTIDALNAAVAALEGGEAAFSYASGMAAISAAVLALVQPGEHILASSIIYGGTYGLFTNHLNAFGIDVSFADVWDFDSVESAFKENTRILYIEPLMNPTLQVADLPRLAGMAEKRDVSVVVDNTFTPPYLFCPLAHGAALSLHSTTKFIGGHGDAVGGIVVGAREIMERMVKVGRVYGGVMSPFNAWLTLRGLRTLSIRLKQACANASAVAQYLEDHPKVNRVCYPGLDSHPQHGLAGHLLGDYGAMVAFDVKGGGLDTARTISDAFRVITSTVSLGEVDTVAAHPASSSHRTMSTEYRQKYGITDGLIRLSIGIEDAEDLIADLDQALANV